MEINQCVEQASRRWRGGRSLGHVVVGEEARARDEAVRAGGRAGADRLRRGLDTAVYLDVDIQAAVDDPLADLLLCGNQNFTARSRDAIVLDGVAMPVPRRSTEPGRPRHRREMT